MSEIGRIYSELFPRSNAIMSSFLKIGAAEYVVSDDLHYSLLGVKTVAVN